MEKLLADIDHKSSVSSGDQILKTDDSSLCDEDVAMSDKMSEDNTENIIINIWSVVFPFIISSIFLVVLRE
jgi:hypothetical protein